MAGDKHWTAAAREALARAEEAAEEIEDPGAKSSAYATIAIGHLLTGLDKTLTGVKTEVSTLAGHVDVIQGDLERISLK